MIPLLLWRCPLCAANDALLHTPRRLGGDLVRCTSCRAEWRLRRVPGDAFYLRLTTGVEGQRAEQPLSAWYDRMKATLQLLPIADSEFAPEAGETLWLASRAMELEVEEADPLFFPQDAPSGRVDKSRVAGVRVGEGRLFLSDRRLVWQRRAAEGSGPRLVSFPLTQVNSAFAMMDFCLGLLVGMRFYGVYPLQESILKWVAYLALVAPQVRAATGHTITTSHY